MNKYLEKIAEMNLLEASKKKQPTSRFSTEFDTNKKMIDHPTNSEEENLLETEEANRIASP